MVEANKEQGRYPQPQDRLALDDDDALLREIAERKFAVTTMHLHEQVEYL